MALVRIVIDTNTLLRGLIAPNSASADVLRAAEDRRVVTLLSKPVIDEYRAVLLDERMTSRFSDITPDVVEITLRRLRYIGEYVRSPAARFSFRRDPRDSKFLELAIELHATHIVSHDNDLLTLPSSRGDAGRRFHQRLPATRIVNANEFISSLTEKRRS